MAAGDLVTAEHHLEWRETLWGWPNTSVSITDLTGWLDLPSLRGGNADRPGRHGTFPGQKRLGERLIEVELTVIAEDATALADLRDATVIDEDPVEEPLVVWSGTTGPELVMARLERRAVPTDHAWSVGHHRAVLQWVATDPRRYSVTEHVSAPIGLPTATGGSLAFPLSFPLAFGTASGQQQLTLVNAGNVATWPTFTVTGPVVGPIITNASTGRRLQFAATFEVTAGQTLVIDADARSVTVNGVSRRDALVIAEWFPLPAGSTVVTFAGVGAYDPASQLVVSHRDASL